MNIITIKDTQYIVDNPKIKVLKVINLRDELLIHVSSNTFGSYTKRNIIFKHFIKDYSPFQVGDIIKVGCKKCNGMGQSLIRECPDCYGMCYQSKKILSIELRQARQLPNKANHFSCEVNGIVVPPKTWLLLGQLE